MTTSRRDLLRFAALGAAAGGLSSFQPLRAMNGRSFAPQTNDKLFCIFLRGAMDPLYTIAPTAALDPTYANVRANLLTPVGITNPPIALGANALLSDHWRILANPQGPIANQHARFVMQIGNPLGQKSHFDEWEILERALQPNGFGLSEDGVFARLAKAAGFDPNLPMSTVGPNLQRWFRSPDLIAAHVKSIQEYHLAHEDWLGTTPPIQLLPPTYDAAVHAGMQSHYGQAGPATSPGKEAHAVGKFVLASEAIVNPLPLVPPPHNALQFPFNITERNNLPASEPELPLAYAPGFYMMRQCEEAMHLLETTTCSVVGVDVHGWDTHVNQATQRAALDPWVAKALHSLYLRAAQLSQNGHPTTILVVTEFGRTVIVNGNGGTDHGIGGWMGIFGPTVAGNTLLTHMDPASWVQLGQLAAGPDALPVKTDFRTVFREYFRKRFALNTTQMTAVLPQPPLAGYDAPLGVFV